MPHPTAQFSLQVEAFTSAGFLHRKGLQYHWRNRDRNSENNGAGASGPARPTADSVVPIRAISPTETALGELPGEDGGEQNAKKKYRDFEGYLGNFASKRRIKVRRLP